MNPFRQLTVLLVLSTSIPLAGAEDLRASRDHASMEEGRRALESMRGTYAYVLQKEQAAKAARDPVRLNRLHVIANRIADLVTVANHSMDDMRVAVASLDAPEAVEAELEKIVLIRAKVEQARQEADSDKERDIEASPTDRDPGRGFDNDDWNLATSLPTSTPPGYPPCQMMVRPVGSSSEPATGCR